MANTLLTNQLITFVRWLKDNQYYDQFMKNLKGDFSHIQHDIDIKNFVMGAFLFYSTDEGGMFWMRVSNEWSTFVQTHQSCGT